MTEKKRFAVETISTFAEVHIVFAENEEEAKTIKKKPTTNPTNRKKPKKIFSPVVVLNGSPELRTDATAHWDVLARSIRPCLPSGRVITPTRPLKCL